MFNFITIKGLQTFLAGLRNIFISKDEAKTYVKTVEETDDGILFKDGNGNVIFTLNQTEGGLVCTCKCSTQSDGSCHSNVATSKDVNAVLDDVFKNI